MSQGWVRRLQLCAVGVVGVALTSGVAGGAIRTQGRATPPAGARALALPTNNVSTAAIEAAPHAAATAAPATAAPRAVDPPKQRTLDQALGAVVIDGCSYALLPTGLAAVGLGLAGGSLPREVPDAFSTVTQVIGVPAGAACTALPISDTQTVCTGDAVAVQSPGLVPPVQGRIVDIVEGAETSTGQAHTASGQLKSAGGCKTVQY